MAFSDDSGGFAFSCTDAKMSIGASTWATRLSQISKATGEILILTRGLPDIDYITKILDKRPRDIWIVAHADSTAGAKALKAAKAVRGNSDMRVERNLQRSLDCLGEIR